MGLNWLPEQTTSIYLIIVKEKKNILLEVRTEILNFICINTNNVFFHVFAGTFSAEVDLHEISQ
jgi:hypothetical protein